MLATNLAALCLKPKNLTEAKLKNNELISLAEEISGQPDVESGVVSNGEHYVNLQ